MLNIKSIITSKPTDSIKDTITYLEPDIVRIYIDVKNAARTLFIPEVMDELLTASKPNQINSVIFQGLLYYAAWWKFYLMHLNVKSEIIFFSDVGISTIYHKNISKDYKLQREQSQQTSGALENDFAILYRANLDLAEKIINKLPTMYYVKLKNLESDFVPHFCKTRVFTKNEKAFNIICSGDKDMFQLLDDNTMMVFKQNNTDYSIGKHDAIKYYFKSEGDEKLSKKIEKINPDWIVSIMSLVGDSIDNVKGLHRFGIKKAADIFSNDAVTEALFGGSPTAHQKLILETDSYFPDTKDLDKEAEKLKVGKSLIEAVGGDDTIIKNAYKLISYEALCKDLEKKDSPSKIRIINQFYNIFNTTGEDIMESSTVLIDILQKNLKDLQLTKDHIEALFY